jgi:hypothetical protein
MKILKNNYAAEKQFYITKKDNFKKTNFCETYSQYGQKIGCYDAGCIIDEENENNNDHVSCMAWNYWDGRNWQSIILNDLDIENSEWDEVNKEESKKILKEMPETPWIDGIDTTIETENYIFYYCRYSDFPWICTVNNK